MKIFAKYKTGSSVLVLSAYLLIFITNTFHYHPIVFLEELKFNSDKGTILNDSDLYLVNLSINCWSQVIFSAVQTAENFDGGITLRDKNSLWLSCPDNLAESFPEILHSSNPLRAPPSL